MHKVAVPPECPAVGAAIAILMLLDLGQSLDQPSEVALEPHGTRRPLIPRIHARPRSRKGIPSSRFRKSDITHKERKTEKHQRAHRFIQTPFFPRATASEPEGPAHRNLQRPLCFDSGATPMPYSPRF